jgi:hypothetical protein
MGSDISAIPELTSTVSQAATLARSASWSWILLASRTVPCSTPPLRGLARRVGKCVYYRLPSHVPRQTADEANIPANTTPNRHMFTSDYNMLRYQSVQSSIGATETGFFFSFNGLSAAWTTDTRTTAFSSVPVSRPFPSPSPAVSPTLSSHSRPCCRGWSDHHGRPSSRGTKRAAGGGS